MTHNKLRLTVTAVVLLVAVLANTQPASADVPQMINYQGRLTDTSGNAYCHDTATIVFAIYSDPDAVTSLWTETQLVSLHYGLFSVRLGDLTEIPTSVFDGSERWLGISPAAGTEILPRTLITSQAYAYHAHHADTADYALASPGSDSCNWYVLDSVIFTDKYWGIARGGAGNVLYGGNWHSIVNLGVACTTGVESGSDPEYTTVSGGYGNRAKLGFGTVGGGIGNVAGPASTVSGGGANHADGSIGFATVGGGSTNAAVNNYATVSGGSQNAAGGWGGSVGGGTTNSSEGDYSTVGGGRSDTASGESSTIAGGEYNSATGPRSFVGGGASNTASAENGTVSGGYENTAGGQHTTVGGGYGNVAQGGATTVGGGVGNYADAPIGFATVGGGFADSAAHNYATVSGGSQNKAFGWGSSVGGGIRNTASGNYSAVGGGRGADAAGESSTIAGGQDNTASGHHSFVGGGGENSVAGDYSAILGGWGDTISSSAHYSHLFGINSDLTEDSTFMVDMPHIRFGDETDGYEFPPQDGNSGQYMATDGSGQLSWTDPAAVSDGDWTINGDDMYSTPPGNVGVGTTNPQSKLDVSGNVRTSGNIGVGKVPSATYELDVAGDIRADEDVVVTDNLSVYDGKLVVAPTGTAVPVGYKLYVKGQMRTDSNLIVDERVGIGTTNPTTTLYVDGNIRFKFDFFGRYSLSAGSSQTITHNLSGDPDSMVVFIHGESSGYSGRHQCHLGSAYVPSLVGWRGVEWYGLTGTQITIARGDKDNRGDAKDWDYVYVRIIKNQ